MIKNLKTGTARRLRKKKLFVLMPLVLLVLLLLFPKLLNNIFLVTKIDCKTQYGPCLAEDERVLESFLGKSLTTLDEREVKSRIGQSFANRKIVVQKVFPSAVVVFIERRKPIVSLKITPQDKGSFMVDEEGVVVEYTESSSLPVVDGVVREGLIVGNKIADDVQSATVITSLLFKAQGVHNCSLNGDSLVCALPEGQTVYFSTTRDSQVSVGALQLIQTRSRIDGKLPKTIDLRYINPVLIY